jgi:hypothetical protein
MTYRSKLMSLLRWVLLLVASAATLFVVVVTFRNWRADAAWQRVIADHAARGDPLAYAAHEAAPMPVNRNFFQTPLLVTVLAADDPTVWTKNTVDALRRPFPYSVGTGWWHSGRFLDLAAAQRDLEKAGALTPDARRTPAEAVLAALEPWRAALDELRRAAQMRPESRLDELPNDENARQNDQSFGRNLRRMSIMERYANALGVRASAELATGRVDEALADTVALLRFLQGINEWEKTGVPFGLLGSAVQPYWEGLQRHIWSEPQLAALQAEFARLRPLQARVRILRRERALTLRYIEEPPNRVAELGVDWYDGIRQFFDNGWLNRAAMQQNRMDFCRYYDAAVLAGIDTVADRVVMDRSTSSLQEMEAQTRNAKFADDLPGRIPSVLSQSPHLSNQLENDLLGLRNIVMMEMPVRCLIASCALERYRLAHGSYPERLAEVAVFLAGQTPRDPVDGEPLRYVRTSPDTYKLYSIGLNARDDGGTVYVPERPKKGAPAVHHRLTDVPPGDWVWPQLAGKLPD